jgi:predicted ATPase
MRMESVQRVTFGQLLRHHRLAAQLTQEQLAAVAGIGVRSIGDLERDVSRVPHAETLRLLADALELTGAARTAFEAAGRRLTATDADQTRSAPVPDLPAFVGRAEELALITRLLDGEIAPLLLFAGEPGIGKSRLLAEAATMASAQGWRVIAGRSTPRSRASYEPIVSALARDVQLASPVRQRLDLQGCGWLVRLLPELLETQLIPAPMWTLPPEQERRLIFDAVTRYLTNVAGPAGTLLLLDDLQWVGGDALALLETLVMEGSPSRPISLRVLGAYRETDVRPQDLLGLLLADLIRDRRAIRHHLDPLTHEEAAHLLAHLWPEDHGHWDAVVREEILRRAEGLPFFLVSSAYTVRDGTSQGDARSGWRVPVSVAESVRARVAALPEAARRLAEVAAVSGRVFAAQIVLAVTTRPEEETLGALDALVHARLLLEEGDEHYRFSHDLIREVIEDDLGKQRRRLLHRRLAEELEQGGDHAYAGHAAEIASHFHAAGERRRALPYALLAGDQAEAMYAHAEAEDHYRTALALAQEVGDQPHAGEALEKLGAAVLLLGRHRESAERWEQAMRTYQEMGDQLGELRTLAGLLQAYSEVGREKLDEAVAQARKILARIEPPDATAILPALGSALAAAHSNLGWILWISGLFADAQVETRRAVDLARIADDDAQLAQAQFRLLIAGGLEQTAEAFEETLALAERSGQTAIVVTSHNMAAFMYMEAGDFAQALAHMEQSVAAAEQRQDPRHLAWQLKNFALFLFRYGDWRRMRDMFAHADAIMREVDRHGETWQSPDILLYRGMFALAEGREEEGRTLLEGLMERLAQGGPASDLPEPTCLLAEADLLAGDAEQARQRLATLLSDPLAFTPAEHYAREPLLLMAWAEIALGRLDDAEARLGPLLATASPFFRTDALRIQGLLATVQGRWKKAVGPLEEAIERARAMPYPYAELKAMWIYGRLETARGDPAAARTRFKQALVICDRLGEELYRSHVERDLVRLKGTGGSNTPE